MGYIVLLLGIVIGFLAGIRYISFLNKKRDTEYRKRTEKLFTEVTSGDLIFYRVINNIVELYAQNKKYKVFYMINKRELCIFEDDLCIAISSSISKELTDKIIDTIDKKFKKEINDVIVINGQTVSKKYLETIANPSDIENIINKNKSKLSVDDILDKINKFGKESLTEEELIFLKNQ
jgi:hypothetical protein